MLTKISDACQADSVSVVIPVFSNAAGLENTLASIIGQHAPGRPFQVFVANDAADPEVNEVCLRFRVFMLTIAPRRGSYFARNRALEHVKGDPIVFLDAGIAVPPGWLAAALQALGDADYLACEVDITPVPQPTAAQAYEMKHAFPVAHYLRSQHFGVTAGLLVTRRLLAEVGGFDERLLSGGDLEFGDRVHRAGIRQAYLPSPPLFHPPRRALSFFRKQFRARIGHRNLARLYPQRFPARSPASLLADLARALLPPRPRAMRHEFPAGTAVPAWRRFLFLWAFKVCRAAAGLAALLAPKPGPPRPAERIERFDFSAHGR